MVRGKSPRNGLGKFTCPECGHKREVMRMPDRCPACFHRLAPLPLDRLSPAEVTAKAAQYDDIWNEA